MKTVIGNEMWIKACSFYLRMKVFVQEDGILLTDEYDQYDADPETQYVLLMEGETVAATGRVQRKTENIARLERICVKKEYRNQHIGGNLIQILEECGADLGYQVLEIHALVEATGFYEKLGYQLQPGIYQEDGCKCQTLLKSL